MRGKTETIKQRALYIYLPSLEMAEEWKRLAERDKMSISKFIIENVENSLKQRDDYSKEHGYVSKAELVKENMALKQELAKLAKDNEMLRAAFDKLDGELKRYRMEPFLKEEFKGVRGYEKELVELFKSSEGKVRSDELLFKLSISPEDRESIKAINRQLENLERYGLLEAVPGGWIWRG
jgi:cell division protein FtsB